MKSTMDENLGFMYLAEQVSPDDNTVNNLTYNDKAGVLFAEFDTILQTFGDLNRNKRTYIAKNVADNLKTERILDMLRHNGWFGEMDHPTQETDNAKLTPERIRAIWMPNRSHKIIQPVVNGDVLTAKIQTASGTEAGRGMAMEIIQGLIPCFSCRAIASLQNINGKPTVIVRFIVTYDWVLYPSHKEASMQGTANMINKTMKAITESTQEAVNSTLKKFKKFSENVCLPLEEVLSNIGKTDINAQMVMEAFDLDEDSVCGMNPETNHLILRDGANQMYVNMSPNTKREVKDFLTSF